MGVSIHYKGRIADPSRIVDLRGDLRRFAAEKQWELLDLTGQDESEILEIFVYPPEHSEPLCFLFNRDGRLHPPFEFEGAESAWCSVKTQYGPLEAHVGIVELLRRLRHSYIPDLEVVDEGAYWETEDMQRLRSALESLVNDPAFSSEGLTDMGAGSESEGSSLPVL